LCFWNVVCNNEAINSKKIAFFNLLKMTEHVNILSGKRQNILLLFVCVIALVFFKIVAGYYKTFDREHIRSDVLEYYSFVPAVFECHDLSYEHGCPEKYWNHKAPNGHQVNKRSVGMAYMYTPFYGLAQLASVIKGVDDKGYSQRTQKILVLGIWIYVCIGLFFLGKAMFQFFSPAVVVSTLFLLIATTNLVWYTNGEPLFTHGVNFMWLSIIIYFTIRYHEKQSAFSMSIIAFSISMLTLIRPVNLMLGVFPLIYGVYNKETLRLKAQQYIRNYKHILIAVPFFILLVIPQLLYWKYATGNWIFYSYMSETFFWDRPFIFKVLFSFRKGWFIYTPVMLLIIAGFRSLWHNAKKMFFPVIIIFSGFLYVISCWWAWTYGGSFGMRPMIDIYPLLAFSIGALLHNKKWWMVTPMAAFIVFCTFLNLYQGWQYSVGILHYDQMNYETYRAIWRKNIYPPGYDLTIAYPDYAKESTGKGSYYDLNEITLIEVSIKFIRADFVCATDTGNTGLKANHESAGNCDAFTIHHDSSKNKFIIRSSETKKYLRLDPITDIIFADADNNIKASRFAIRSFGYNKFCLIGENGKYVTSREQNQFILKADSKDLVDECYVVLKKYGR
jgi:hypothetical protein